MSASSVSLAKIDDILACPVCLIENDKESLATNCGHLYHKLCIDQVLAKVVEQRLCPLCNTSLTTTAPIPFAMLELISHIKPMEVTPAKIDAVAQQQLAKPVPEYDPKLFECPPKPNLSLLALPAKDQEVADLHFFSQLINGNRIELVEAICQKPFLKLIERLKSLPGTECFVDIAALYRGGKLKEAIDRFFLEYRPGDGVGWGLLFHFMEFELEAGVFRKKLEAAIPQLNAQMEALLLELPQISACKNGVHEFVLGRETGWIMFFRVLNKVKELAEVRAFFLGTPQQYTLDNIMLCREVFHKNSVDIVNKLKSCNFPLFIALIRSIDRFELALNSVKAKWILGKELEAVMDFLNTFHVRWDWHEFLEALGQFPELADIRKLFGTPKLLNKS